MQDEDSWNPRCCWWYHLRMKWHGLLSLVYRYILRLTVYIHCATQKALELCCQIKRCDNQTNLHHNAVCLLILRKYRANWVIWTFSPYPFLQFCRNTKSIFRGYTLFGIMVLLKAFLKTQTTDTIVCFNAILINCMSLLQCSKIVSQGCRVFTYWQTLYGVLWDGMGWVGMWSGAHLPKASKRNIF